MKPIRFFLIIPVFFFSLTSGKSQSFFQKKKTTAINRTVQHRYGVSTGISDSFAIVGAYWDDRDPNGNNPYSTAGSAYLLERKNGMWIQIQKIVPLDRGTDPGGQAVFGEAVGISGNVAVIGASGEDYDTSAQNQIINGGAAYVFERDTVTGIWSQKQKIIASDRGTVDNFGSAVAISGNYLIIGAYKDDEDASGANTKVDAGSAYIFERDTTGKWIQKNKIVANDRIASDYFGWTVSITSDGYAIVGAYAQDYDSSGVFLQPGAGAAYIFKRSAGGNWIQSQKLISKDREANGRYGISVDINKDRCIVGADIENEGSRTLCGSAYVYERVAGNYKFIQKIIAADIQDSDGFGRSVSIDGDIAIAGATGHDHLPSSLIANGGAIYIYQRQPNGTWAEQEHIASNDRGPSDLLGINSHISNNTIITGVYFEDEDTSGNNTLSESGSAYIFEQCTPTYDTTTLTTCDSYTSPSGNHIWSISGSYTDTIFNWLGCDSVILFNLTILNSSTTSITDSACNSYTSVNSGRTWYTSGIYVDTLANYIGCDSLITINLTITTIDTTLTFSLSSSIVQSNQAGASYQWLNCDSAFAAISGATARNYLVTANGNYAVAITRGSCTDTSSCVNVANVGFENIEGMERILIYPNPVKDILTLANLPQQASVTLLNSLGEVILKEKVNMLNLSNILPGIYLLKIEHNDHSLYQSVIKQ